MDCRELRIGNLIQDYLGNIVTVERIDKDGVLGHSPNPIGVTHGNSVEPIPLTDEWLKRFGLKIEALNGNSIEGVIGRYEGEDDIKYVVDFNPSEYGDYNYTTKTIKYVHQLQNIYFTLTGEELKYV